MTRTAKILSGAAVIAVALVATLAITMNSGSEDENSASGAEPSALSASTSAAPGPFRSRPFLKPPRMQVKKNAPGATKLKTFMGSKVSGAAIYAADGEPVWFRPCRCMDFRTQTYRGKPVLTWFQGVSKGSGLERNTYMIANRNYKVIKRVYPGPGLDADSHEFRLTRRGTAYVTAYNTEIRDLRSVGMGRRAPVSDSIAQEIDLRTGRVLWQWRSLDHVPIRHTYAEKLRRPGNPFDYFHINSIIDTPDGNIMISGRSTNAIYKISRRTGRIIWTLGGKDSDFRMGKGAFFSSQHDAQPLPGNRVSLFDNGDSPVLSKPVRKQSRGLILKLDNRRDTARVAQQFFNPAAPLASQQANMQRLGNGNFFVGWGGVPLVSEHAADGRLLYDAEFKGISSFYRAYRDSWSGRARGKVAVAARRNDSGTRLWVSWNGDSKVRRWRVAAGGSKGDLSGIGTWKRKGFETSFNTQSRARYFKVTGLDGNGRSVGSSAVIPAG